MRVALAEGFEQGVEAVAVEHYRPWFQRRQHRVVQLATRRQGLMVAPGNPKRIYDVGDLARPDVRFINRQPGSGTRYLLDLMLQQRGIEASAIRGYEQCEFTHAAVAAFVASGPDAFGDVLRSLGLFVGLGAVAIDEAAQTCSVQKRDLRCCPRCL